MGENYRNSQKLRLDHPDKHQLKILNTQHGHDGKKGLQTFPNSKLDNVQNSNLPIQLPVTHLKIQGQQSMVNLTDLSHSLSSQQALESFKSPQQKLNKIADLLTDYEAIMAKLDNKDTSSLLKTIQDLNALCNKCLDFKIELPLKFKASQPDTNDNKSKSDKNYEFSWLMLIISGSLNLWKLIAQNNDIEHQVKSIIEVVRKPCKKIISILQISNNAQSQFGILPDKIKNKLILLIIIWAKEELAIGNKDQSLRICNVCSFLITNNDDNQTQNSKNAKAINKQTKFKLHYLRMKIFHELGQTKEEVEEIIICEGLLASMGQITNKKKDKSNKFDNQLFEMKPNNSKMQKQNNSQILARLEKRKQQILGLKKSFKHLSTHVQRNLQPHSKNEKSLSKCNSKFKQVRDSFQMTFRDEEKTIENCFPKGSLHKSKSIKQIRSVSAKKFNKPNENQNDAYDETCMKITVKQQFKTLGLNRDGQSGTENQTLNKFDKKSKLRIGDQNKKSLSVYKGGMDKASMQNKSKIQQKYELTSKKLVKRPIMSTNKNKQFEDVLLGLEAEACSRENEMLSLQIKNGKCFTPIGYYDLLAKRPQNKYASSCLNENKNEGQLIQASRPQNEFKQRRVSTLQKDENMLNENRQKLIATVSSKTLQQCIQKIQKQTIQKYFQKMTAKRRKNINYSDNDNYSEGRIENDQSATELSDSDLSSDIAYEKSKEKSKDGNERSQGKFNQLEDSMENQQNDFVFEVIIENAFFPGLAICDRIKVSIRKLRTNAEINTIHASKYCFMMSVSIYCELGVFWLRQRMPENLMDPGLSIMSNINKFSGDFTSIRMENRIEEQRLSQNQILNKKLLKYLKNSFEISNKGLGLYLKQKNKLQRMGFEGNLEQSDMFKKISSFSCIYLQNRKCLQFLFSEENLFDAYFRQINLLPNKSANMSPIDKLKILFVAIRRKSKNEKQGKAQKINKPNKSCQKVNIMSQDQIIQMNQEWLKKPTQVEPKNFKSANKRLEKRKSILKLNGFQPAEATENSSQRQLYMENLLVPVVKYIVLGQTSKPKYKLKTMITKTKQANFDFCPFPSQEQIAGYENRRMKRHQRVKSNKYGLLTPYIDDQSTVKIRNISTSIYGHIISKFFMEGSQKISELADSIPDQFLLSLKHYLMIPSQGNATKAQYQDYRCSNIIDRFYQKFQYSFFIRLNCNQARQNRKTHIINVNLFRVKKLYRKGLENFYLIKFSVQEKSARTQIDQLIATSYDIKKHFTGPQFNLIKLLEDREDDIVAEPIQYIPYSNQVNNASQLISATNLPIKGSRQKQSATKGITVNREESINMHDGNSNLNQRPHPEKNQIQLQLVSDQHSQSEAQVHSEVQLHLKTDQKGKDLLSKHKNFKSTLRKVYKDENNSNYMHLSSNRVSCPEKQFLNQIKQNHKSYENLMLFSKNAQPRSYGSKSEIQQKENKSIIYSQLNSFKAISQTNQKVDEKQEIGTNPIKQTKMKLGAFPKMKEQKDNIAACLKKISERITIYKTFLHSKIGIQPLPAPGHESAEENEEKIKQKIACYANKFRFSRNKILNSTEEFLSPHLNCLQILFQKTTKIKCDGVFAILTVFKIKLCTQFYIKIYVPSCQKTMSFSVSCKVFQYFTNEDLIKIFSPFIQFDLNQLRLQKKKIQSNGSLKELLCKETAENQEQSQQFLEKQYMGQKISAYFANQVHQKDEGYLSNLKIIWSRICEHLQFERRCLGSRSEYEQEATGQQENQSYYLIVKLGEYEAFVKNFSVDQYIVVNNGKTKDHAESSSILQVEVSLGQKMDGLNFIDKNKHTKAIKLERKLKNRKKVNPIKKRSEPDKKICNAFKQCKNIYESETNKQIVYICIGNSKTNEQICYSYYLCQILHLIDSSNLMVARNQDNSQFNQLYRIQSEEFKELILNYAVLFKVLNYIKNEFIIQLQGERSYLPRLYQDSALKQQLKNNVDKILLDQDQSHDSKFSPNLNISSASKSGHKQPQKEDFINKILGNLLNCTLGLSNDGDQSQTPTRIKQRQRKQNVKITFNSEIKSQRNRKISFLVRKVVARKGYPISCMFLSKLENRLKIYLSSSKNGRTRQIQIPIESHPMPFMDILINKNQSKAKRHLEDVNGENLDASEMEESKKQVLIELAPALRNRLRKYHHNLTLLASI